MRIALDSNVMIYAEGLTDDLRNGVAQELIGAIPGRSLIIPLQAAAETLRWLLRKAKLPHDEAKHSINRWIDNYATQPTDSTVMKVAVELVASHRLQVFDAVVLAAAAEARAAVLLSEDMQDGFQWRGVTIVNPFAVKPSPIIAPYLIA